MNRNPCAHCGAPIVGGSAHLPRTGRICRPCYRKSCDASNRINMARSATLGPMANFHKKIGHDKALDILGRDA